jgi:hypothetical protein
MLVKRITTALQTLGLDERFTQKAAQIIRMMTNHQQWSAEASTKDTAVYRILQSWLSDPEAQRFLQINRYQGILWYNQEAFGEFLWWTMVSEVISVCAGLPSPEHAAEQIVSLFEIIQKLQTADKVSNYQVDKLLSAVIGSF